MRRLRRPSGLLCDRGLWQQLLGRRYQHCDPEAYTVDGGIREQFPDRGYVSVRRHRPGDARYCGLTAVWVGDFSCRRQ